MASRLELQAELEALLGSKNVYFQPPESKKLQYDCIVYSRDNIETKKADNKNYMFANRYTLTFIYRDPDSEKPKQILERFDYCRMTNHVVVDNLYHDVYSLYY